MNQTNITDSTLIAVSRQKHLKGLKKFWVNSCHHLTITGVSALIDTWILEGIENLDIGGLELDDEIFLYLCKAKHLSSLQVLTLNEI